MTNDPRPSDMLLFAAVVREGSFTGAARAHGLTKQAVSARVARLEERLGVRLLERTTRRVRPTDVGATYHERCSRIAAEIDEANQEVRARQAQPTGQLRVSAPYLFGRRFLAPILTAYLRAYPEVRVELVLGDRRVNLVDEGFDLAIRVGALDDSTLSARKLGSARSSTVASPRLLARASIDRPEQLASVACVGIRAEEEWPVAGRRLRVRPALVVNDLELACAAAVASLGVAHLPDLVTADHLRSGKLLRILEPVAPVMQPVFAVYPSRRFLAARVRVFLDRLVAARTLVALDTAGPPAARRRPRRPR